MIDTKTQAQEGQAFTINLPAEKFETFNAMARHLATTPEEAVEIAME